jgi:hypothetical protein
VQQGFICRQLVSCHRITPPTCRCCRWEKTVPQRLKPVILGSSYGTAVEAAEKLRESPEGTAELSPCPGKTNVARAVP